MNGAFMGQTGRTVLEIYFNIFTKKTIWYKLLEKTLKLCDFYEFIQSISWILNAPNITNAILQ